jgi:hypothetical protein
VTSWKNFLRSVSKALSPKQRKPPVDKAAGSIGEPVVVLCRDAYFLP